MKTTNALAASMRRILANFHPPSPPTARESQQLLDVLQKSFKNRLDEKHPAPSQHEFWPKSVDRDNIPTGSLSTSSHATNAHLSSILTNPVLGSLNGLRTRQDAILRFEKLIAEPEIDLSRLAGLIRWVSREGGTGGRQQQPTESFSDRLNNWLHITDRLSREAFLLNISTFKAALDLFNRESNEAMLWTWLKLVYERRLIQAHVSSLDWLKVEDDLVASIMRISIRRKDNTDAAHQFLEACRYHFDSGRGASSKIIGTTRPKLSYPALSISGKRLASAILFHRHQHSINSALFDNILKYLPAWDVSSNLNSAFCAVYSPEKPTTKYLYQHLKDEHSVYSLSKSIMNDTPESRKVVMISLLDGSKLALDEGKRHQASFILDFAIDKFPEYLPARTAEQLEPEIGRYLTFIPG